METKKILTKQNEAFIHSSIIKLGLNYDLYIVAHSHIYIYNN